ncbi:MAG: Bax inhibitor-1 family protein [Acidobacteriota bacterium]
MNDYLASARTLPVSELGPSARARFISKTYTHLFGAILAFTGIQIFLFQSGAADTLAGALLGVSWLLVLGAFMVVSWLASRLAHTVESLPLQYVALAVSVVAHAIIFAPLLVRAQSRSGGGVIESAALVTLMAFAALTALVYATGKDFSFLGSILAWGGIIAVVLIVAGVIFGFQLGLFFSVAMVALAGGAILYDTSNILYHYPEDRYVGASLELFASIGLMFWYVLRIFMSRD